MKINLNYKFGGPRGSQLYGLNKELSLIGDNAIIFGRAQDEPKPHATLIMSEIARDTQTVDIEQALVPLIPNLPRLSFAMSRPRLSEQNGRYVLSDLTVMDGDYEGMRKMVSSALADLVVDTVIPEQLHITLGYYECSPSELTAAIANLFEEMVLEPSALEVSTVGTHGTCLGTLLSLAIVPPTEKSEYR
jgi:hypothetical protein